MTVARARWEVVGVDAAFPLVGTVANLIVGAAELQLPFVRVMDPVGLEVPIPQADIGGVDCQLQALLGCLPRRVRRACAG